MKKLKLTISILIIFLSTLVFSSLSFFVYFQIKKNIKNRIISDKYNIKYISFEEKDDTLDVNYLAEILELSLDNKRNIYSISESALEEKLLKSPFIKNAKIKKHLPNNLFVEYELRKPVAFIYDIKNCAVDEDGYIFPFLSFYKEKNLPSIYLNCNEFKSFEKLDNKKLYDALDIIAKLNKTGFFDLIKNTLIDISRIDHKSFGKREIILTINEELRISKNDCEYCYAFPIILRLGINNFYSQISNYFSLREKMLYDYKKQFLKMTSLPSDMKFSPKTVDLRISKLAFIDQ
ncbi:MAG: hypothetical protein A3F40_00345 [Chlamydiae bacterium RIFCSPHIGHO2_12_FULL_27_8]|nr:MAG: hypothetical protein A3F40_00345 [Chlamydiae bacterium RIFCSPHIGHO2_12_FULL_27_8]